MGAEGGVGLEEGSPQTKRLRFVLVEKLDGLLGEPVVLEELDGKFGGGAVDAACVAVVVTNLLALGGGEAGGEVAFVQAMGEAVALCLVDEVHLADGSGEVAFFGEVVSNGAVRSGEGVFEDFRAVGVRVEPRDERSAGGDADRGRAVGAFKAEPALGEAVDVGGADLGMAVAAGSAALVLIRHQKQEFVPRRGEEGGCGEEGAAGNHYTHATKDL